MIALVDLQISNLASVVHALRLVGAGDHQVATPDNVAGADAILLPGVGAFGDGMASLESQALTAPIRAAAGRGIPVFGICLGMQLLASRSTEYGEHQGLGLVAGRVERLEATEPGYRVPNIGWCDVRPARTSPLFPDDAGGCFYHVHSYHFIPADDAASAATAEFGGRQITVAIAVGNVFGVQFHTEKSQDDGLRVLSNFLAHVHARKRRAS